MTMDPHPKDERVTELTPWETAKKAFGAEAKLRDTLLRACFDAAKATAYPIAQDAKTCMAAPQRRASSRTFLMR
eukprot:CAMPEP_0168441818 /NCGR_PEP_ID=MMETSP0228-20121227/43689_1 /TAXON_ID=133427 /ORGANISM="Protoceratium reticulatum, Strain CCCM 535 (=CCMP 1889)" /LENGTH=73 /DNA_ID=CAMNT_0008456161 /DNA_START=135 /DNA_END=355 /DNA_ORIENTATION=-